MAAVLGGAGRVGAGGAFDRAPADVRARGGRVPPRRPGQRVAPDRRGAVRRPDHDAARRHCDPHHPGAAGAAFGELALVSDEHERSATVQALEAGETRSVHRSDFDRLRHEHPSVDSILVAILAERVRRLSELLTEAYYLSADARVLRRLADLSDLYDGSVPLPQEALAELAGT